MGDVETRREDDRSANPSENVWNLREEPNADQRCPDQLEEVEGHNRGGVGFFQGLSQTDLRHGAKQTDQEQPTDVDEGWGLPDP